VPVVLAVIDARSREIGLIAHIELSDDSDADMRSIARHYQGRQGFRTQLASPIRFI
jgi:hypothetical protein